MAKITNPNDFDLYVAAVEGQIHAGETVEVSDEVADRVPPTGVLIVERDAPTSARKPGKASASAETE